MDFDKPKVYGDTSITDGLIFFKLLFFLKGWLAIAKLKPLSLFISLLSMPMKAFDNIKINQSIYLFQII